MDMMLDANYTEFIADPIKGEHYVQWVNKKISQRRKKELKRIEEENANETNYYEK